MQTIHVELEELACPADDNCSNLPDRTGDTKTYDLAELWRDLGGSD